jgi:hypothetical protein
MAVGSQILLIRMPARAEWHPSGVPPPVIIHHSLGRRVWAFARTANHERPMRGAAARASANPAPQSMYVRTYVRVRVEIMGLIIIRTTEISLRF